MVSIVSQESPSDLIGNIVSRGIQENRPGAVQRGYQRQTGLNALDTAEQNIEKANGDPYKIALAFAKAGAQNPNLERSLGPLLQTAMTQSKTQRAFPQSQQNNIQDQSNQEGTSQQTQTPKSDFPTPSPFNIMTKDQMNKEAERWATAVNDPNGYQTRYAQLENQNNTAISQKDALENSALKAGVEPGDLARFMVVNQGLDPSNPSEWAQKAVRNFAEVKNNDDILRRTFIPGIGNGLLGQNRAEDLKRLERPVQENAKRGLEQEDRKYLASNYVTPTEIELLYHPLTNQKEKAIESLPNGLFPAQKKETWGSLTTAQARKSPFVSYEEALEKDPQALKIMQDRLSDFFGKNIDKNTSILGLRDKIWSEKDYDWRQFEPAIVQAIQEKGIKLEPFQEREMAGLTQAPMQSMPEIFKSMDRFIHYLRGSK